MGVGSYVTGHHMAGSFVPGSHCGKPKERVVPENQTKASEVHKLSVKESGTGFVSPVLLAKAPKNQH